MKITKDKLSKLLNLVIASAKIRKIIIEQEYGNYELRPQIHLIITGKRGRNKSTILNEVTKHFNSNPYNDLTPASLIGTIDAETKEVLPGAGWDCRNSVCCIDEFLFKDAQSKPNPIINILLNLTEGNQYYKKRLAIKNSRNINFIDKDCYYKVNNGEIELKTNFSLIIVSMQDLRFANSQLQAMVSRCIPLIWDPPFEILKSIAMGQKLFEYKNLIKGNTTKKIKRKDYEIIVNHIIKLSCSAGNFLRCVGDCSRAFAILGYHDYELYEDILYYKSEF
jgi:hypothetical protein